MRITKEQENILDSLICQRLKDDDKNTELIKSFNNEKGILIVEYLKQYGLKEDIDGDTAFYIVKTKQDDVLMFFSMKCGELFDPLFDEEEIEENYEEYLLIIQALKNADTDFEVKENAFERLKVMSKSKGMPIHKVLNQVLNKTKEKGKMLNALHSDKEREGNENISRVNKTYPGIELVHFCTNENARQIWDSYNMGHSMGEVIFWKYIVPKFFSVQEIVGCEYAFLFAADLSEDRTLINYYNVSLKFETDVEVGTNKPLYDFACAFMCQKLSKMKENRNRYFCNFNIDSSDIVT